MLLSFLHLKDWKVLVTDVCVKFNNSQKTTNFQKIVSLTFIKLLLHFLFTAQKKQNKGASPTCHILRSHCSRHILSVLFNFACFVKTFEDSHETISPPQAYTCLNLLNLLYE